MNVATINPVPFATSPNNPPPRTLRNPAATDTMNRGAPIFYPGACDHALAQRPVYTSHSFVSRVYTSQHHLSHHGGQVRVYAFANSLSCSPVRRTTGSCAKTEETRTPPPP